MQQFTIEYWYYYNGANQKDFEEETITASTYEAAVAILKSLHKHIFKTTDKTNYEINN
jgi:precorrin-6x reductase